MADDPASEQVTTAVLSHLIQELEQRAVRRQRELELAISDHQEFMARLAEVRFQWKRLLEDD